MRKEIAALFIIANLIFADAVYAQSITIGSGTAVNATTVSSPVNIWYRQCVSQSVYTVAELNAAGITGPAIIRQIGHYVTQAPIYAIPDYQISMKHTTATNASANLAGGYTVVKAASTYMPTAGGWDLHNLTTPFSWDGAQNIVVRICWSQIQPTYNASGQCRVFSSAGGYRYRWNDNPGNACGLTPNTTINSKPQLHLIFDTVTVWTGAVSSDWDNATNWTKGVPNRYIDALIPAGTPNNPNVSTTDVCEELILEGTMDIASGGILEVYSHLTSTGTLNDGGGIIKMKGTAASNISGTMTISNLWVENGGGTTVSSGTISISRELRVNKSVFNTSNAVILTSTAAGTARINELNHPCSYTLTMNDSYGDGWNGGYITVLENGVAIGTFAAAGSGSTGSFAINDGSTLVLNYTAGTWETENSVSLQNPLGATIFTDNAPIATGNIFSTTASCAFSPMVVGDISMERYIDAGETFWRYFTSAVEGATVGEYLDDFVTAGFPGSPWPDFPFNSIYTYDETMGPGSGYVGCTGTSQVINQGQGLQVWCGDTIIGTQPFTLDLVGQPSQGPITMPVTFTNTGTVLEDGWNLVGNPYPSTIDWDSPDWTKVNMANAIYIQNPDNQQYATYVAGASTNGGSRYIASQQSFWVYAAAASPQLVAHEGIKSAVDQAFIKDASILSAGTTIRLQGIEHFDEVVIRDVENALTTYDFEYDAKELWGGWAVMPQLSFTPLPNEDLSVHSFDFNEQEWTVPMRAIVFETGIYHLVFENTGELDVPCLRLEDTYTGITYEISEGLALPFELYDTTWNARFLLHIGKAYESFAEPATCFDGNDGMIEIDLDDPGMVNYDLTVNGNTTSSSASGDPLVITDLASGIYVVDIPSLVNSCGMTTFNFAVNEPSPITPAADTQDELFGNDGSLTVTVTGGTQPYTYQWDSGDISSHLADLAAGTYNLTVTDFNGCTWTGSFTVGTSLSAGAEDETEIKYIYYPEFNKLQIFGWTPDPGQELILVNNAGQVVAKYTCTSDHNIQELDLPANMASGIYLVTSGTNEIQFRFAKN